MESNKSVQRLAENAYEEVYNSLKAKLGAELKGAKGIELVENRKTIDHWLPDGTLLIPKELCPDYELLSAFIAMELIKHTFWSSLLPYLEALGSLPGDHELANVHRISLGMLNLASFEYYAEEIRKEGKEASGIRDSELAALLFAGIEKKKIEDAIDLLETFSGTGFKNEKEMKEAIDAAFILYSDIIPAFVIYKLHADRKLDIELANTLKLSEEAAKNAATDELSTMLGSNYAIFEVATGLSKEDAKQYERLYALFASIPAQVYGSADTEWIARLLANSVLVAKSLLKELNAIAEIESLYKEESLIEIKRK